MLQSMDDSSGQQFPLGAMKNDRAGGGTANSEIVTNFSWAVAAIFGAQGKSSFGRFYDHKDRVSWKVPIINLSLLLK